MYIITVKIKSQFLFFQMFLFVCTFLDRMTDSRGAQEPALDICDFTNRTPWERFVFDLAQNFRKFLDAEAQQEKEVAAQTPKESKDQSSLSSSASVSASQSSFLSLMETTGVRINAPALVHSDVSAFILTGGVCSNTISSNDFDLFSPDVIQDKRTFGASLGLYRSCGADFDSFLPRCCFNLKACDNVIDQRDSSLIVSSLVCAANDAMLDNAMLYVTDSTGDVWGYQLPPRTGEHGPLISATEQILCAPERLCFLDGLFPHALTKFTAVGSIVQSVAVQFLFILHEFASKDWRFAGGKPKAGISNRMQFLWGPKSDPIEQLSLSLQWINDKPREDGQKFTDYDSLSASRWVLRAGFAPLSKFSKAEEQPFLSRSVALLLKAYRECQSFEMVSDIT